MSTLTNNINYFSHTTFDPPFVQRQFERDLPEEASGWWDTAKRVGLIALPFLSLHKPIGQGLSVGMNAVRCYTHLSEAGLAAMRGEVALCLWDVFQAAISALSFVGMVFSFHLGLLISTLHDMILSLIQAVQCLVRGTANRPLNSSSKRSHLRSMLRSCLSAA